MGRNRLDKDGRQEQGVHHDSQALRLFHEGLGPDQAAAETDQGAIYLQHVRERDDGAEGAIQLPLADVLPQTHLAMADLKH